MDANLSPNTSSYSDAVVTYTQMIRQHSPQAADCLEQIRADYGSRTAYLAAFALMHLKNRQLDTHDSPTQRELYAFTFCEEMSDTLAAMRLYDQAAAHLFASEHGSAAL